MQDEVYDENGVRVNYDPKGKEKKVIRKIRNVIPLICVLVYLILGLFFNNSKNSSSI